MLKLLIAGVCALSVLAPLSVSHAQSVAQSVSKTDQRSLKRKVAVGRFTNETRYGQTLLRDSNLDPLGKQAADILTAYLVQSDAFLVFERTDIAQLAEEQSLLGDKNLVGVDTLIIGSIVEFGRSEDGKRGLFNRERTQRAHAKVAIRLVDVRTGLAFHSATGSGEATTETQTTLGMGSTARFDGSLTDKALSVAVEDVLEELVNTIQAREWRTDILAIEEGQIFISGGASQGLKIGDRLSVMRRGRTVESRQSGMPIELPASKIGEIEVASHFGSGDLQEGSVATLVSGNVDTDDIDSVYVVGQ